ncbi:hypothetical protein HAX54_008950 [Datura stramonium]|uniref:DUF295 domain-containing protein n=1 Tax=Datura stramonium TaxID=4076 RepID=A0ABS8RY41_DATST|nr:hypothetical protein [Datura stramonium]
MPLYRPKNFLHALSSSSSASISHGTLRVKPNQIYFIDDWIDLFKYSESGWGGRDVGAYNLEDGKIATFYPGLLRLALKSITVNFEIVKSLINLPYFMPLAAIPVAVREARGLTEDLVRSSVGIEDVNDL